MQTVYDREVTLHSRNVQGRNALTERAGRAAVFYKPAHAQNTARRMAAACRCGAVLRGAAVCVPSVWKGTQPVWSAAPGQDGPAKPGAAQRL